MIASVLSRDIVEDLSQKAFLLRGWIEGLLSKSVGKVLQVKGRAGECKCPAAKSREMLGLLSQGEKHGRLEVRHSRGQTGWA